MKNAERKPTPRRRLGAAGASPSMQSLALAWLARNFGRSGEGAVGQLSELQAMLEAAAQL